MGTPLFADPNLEQALERVTESVGPALGLSRLVSLAHLQEQLAAARDRVRDSHRVQMRALGAEAEESDVAGINVQGDTVVNITGVPVKTGLLRKLLPYAAVVAVGAAAAYYFFQRPASGPSAPAAASGSTESIYRLGLEVTTEP